MKVSKAVLWFIIICMIIPNALVANAATNELQVTFASNPTIVAPGTNGYIEVILKSFGSGTISNIDIAASSWDPSVVAPRGNWQVYIGDLAGGDSLSVLYEFQVSDSASPGLYQIVFEIAYSPGMDIRQTAMVIVEDATLLDIVSVTPSSINIGEVTTLIFNITTNGAGTAGNILFTWEDSSDLILPVGSDNRITVPSLAAGTYALIPIDVVASPSITPGVYPLSITLEFYDRAGTKQTIVSEVGLQIGGTTDFEIIVQQSISGATTFAVANTGANVASSVIVSIPQQVNYIATGASSVSLGNLDAGDYTLATFQIASTQIGNNTQRPSFDRSPSDTAFPDFNFSDRQAFMNRSFTGTGTNELIVEISYTDLFGIRQIVQKEVTISSISASSVSDIASRFAGRTGFTGQSSSTSGDGTMLIILGIVGIIVIITIIQLGRKKKLAQISKVVKEKLVKGNKK